MDTIFDDAIAALRVQPYDWRPLMTALFGNVLSGIAVGIGISIGLALAG